MKISATHLIEYCQNKYGIGDTFISRYNMYRKEEERKLIRPFLGVDNICKRICFNNGNNYLYTHRGRSAIEYLKKFCMDDYFND